MDETPPVPQSSGTARDFGNMLNEYIGHMKRKKKKLAQAYSPWLKIKESL